jgi:hypothetical protein
MSFHDRPVRSEAGDVPKDRWIDRVLAIATAVIGVLLVIAAAIIGMAVVRLF